MNNKEAFMAYAKQRMLNKKYEDKRKEKDIDNYVKNSTCKSGGAR